jgi:hypothetical protein
MRKGILVSMIAVAGLASAANAQYSEGFEAYAPGTLMSGVGGWDGWGGSAGAAGMTSSAQAHSGQVSISTANPAAADAVHPFSGINSGVQTLTAWQYVPTASFTADTYFIVMNAYTHAGGWTWTIEMQFDITTGTVLDDFRPETNTIPIAFDQWSEITIVFDLDNDAQTTFYNGVELSTGTMTRSAGDPLEIANIDLFSTGGEAFYDDISIVPAPGAMGVLALGAGAFMRRRRR